MDSSLGKMCLGKDVIEISIDRNEGSRDWDSPEYKDTTGSGGKKEPEALVFHKMDTEEDSDRYIAQCFVNGLYASDGEINLEKNDNLISNDHAVKLRLEYEVRKGKKLVKKELMVLLCGEIYFVQLIINPEKDKFDPGLIFGRSFLRSSNATVNFGEGPITIQPDFDPFLLSSDEEGKPNLDDLETLLDFDFDELSQTDLPPMVCKMGKGSRNKKKVMENIMYFNNGVGPSSYIGIPLTQEEAEKRALAHNISMRYEILEEVRPVIETLAYNDKYRKLLDEIWADKVRLDGMIKPEEEKAMEKMKGQMLKEKKDPGAFVFPIRLKGRINENALADTRSDTNTMPYRIYEQLGRDDIMKEDRNITMINYTEAEVTSWLVNVLCQVGFTTMSAKFLILEIPVDRDAPIVVGRGFLDTIGGNIDIPNKIFTTFDGCTRQTFRAAKSEKTELLRGTQMTKKTIVWKTVVSFLGSLPAKLRDVEWKLDYKLCYSNPELATGHWKTEIRTYDYEAGSSRAKCSRNVETVEEALLPDVHNEFLERRDCSREAKSRYNSRLATLLQKLIYSPQILDWQLLHKIGCGDEIDQMLNISLKEAQSDEEIFFFLAWVRAFNIREPIYPELFCEFYATYEFDEVRLGLYYVEELNEESFDAYFQGGLRSDENFNAKEYWERISIDRDLHLSRSSITSVRFPILRVLHKMITYRLCQRTNGYKKIQRNDLWLLSMFKDRHHNGYANVAWVIAKWMNRKGAGSHKDSQICCGQFISKIARKSKVLTGETICSLSTLFYYRDFNRTTLRELIDSEDKLIPEIPVDGVPRVFAQRVLRVQRASMQDLYEHMGSMEIRQEAIERMEYRHAYHWDMYQGVFEHMAGVYSFLLQGAYNPPGYAQPSTTSTTRSTIRSSHHSSNMMMRRMSSVG
ncbi:ribonuclease H-like domain-containing protein [Tanacetum coccineum]